LHRRTEAGNLPFSVPFFLSALFPYLQDPPPILSTENALPVWNDFFFPPFASLSPGRTEMTSGILPVGFFHNTSTPFRELCEVFLSGVVPPHPSFPPTRFFSSSRGFKLKCRSTNFCGRDFFFFFYDFPSEWEDLNGEIFSGVGQVVPPFFFPMAFNSLREGLQYALFPPLF